MKLCHKVCAADMIAANSGQSAAKFDKMALLSGGMRDAQLVDAIVNHAGTSFVFAQEYDASQGHLLWVLEVKLGNLLTDNMPLLALSLGEGAGQVAF